MKTELEWKDILEEYPTEGEEVLIVTHNNSMHMMTFYGEFFIPDLEYVTGYDFESEHLSMSSVKYWAYVDSPIIPSSGNRYEDMMSGAKHLLGYRTLTREDVMEIWKIGQGVSQKILNDLLNGGYATREKVNGVYTYSHNSQE